jgi:hypothetical protein
MKLIGSRSEQQMRDELVRSNHSLQNGTHGQALVAALESANVNLARAYVLDWIPEQAEDIYDVLVSRDDVLIVEVSRESNEVQLERQSLAVYKAKCSKVQRLKIIVAQDLLTKGFQPNTKSGD